MKWLVPPYPYPKFGGISRKITLKELFLFKIPLKLSYDSTCPVQPLHQFFSFRKIKGCMYVDIHVCKSAYTVCSCVHMPLFVLCIHMCTYGYVLVYCIYAHESAHVFSMTSR